MNSSGEALMKKIHEKDLLVSKEIYMRVSSSKLLPIMKIFSFSCDGYIWLTILFLSLLLTEGSLENSLLDLFLSINVDIAIVASLKSLIKRSRPSHNVGDRYRFGPDIHSFPSGHSNRAFFVALYATLYFGWIWALLYIWAVLVAFSRVSRGRHYVSDIIGSLIISTIEVLIIYFFVDWDKLFIKTWLLRL